MFNIFNKTEISSYKNNKEYYFSIKHFKDKNLLLIKLKIKKKTSLNSFNTDIYFYIIVNERYPETFPYITCKTNVLFL